MAETICNNYLFILHVYFGITVDAKLKTFSNKMKRFLFPFVQFYGTFNGNNGPICPSVNWKTGILISSKLN